MENIYICVFGGEFDGFSKSDIINNVKCVNDHPHIK